LQKDIGEKRKYHRGKLLYANARGVQQEIDIQLMTRGHFRRDPDICNFPPLKIKFLNKDSDAIFSSIDELKLVTHCNTLSSKGEQYLLREFLAYRFYNLITDYSYRVRLLKIEYRDTSTKKETVIRYGFFIESDSSMSHRNNSRKIDLDWNKPTNPDLLNSTRLSLFQFMIGNTDWYLPDHNVEIIVNEKGDTVAVPYDFDLSGLVNADYNDQFKVFDLESPRDRYFQGFCRGPENFQIETGFYNRIQKEIYKLLREFEPLSLQDKIEIRQYLNTYYEIINSDKKINETIGETCKSNF